MRIASVLLNSGSVEPAIEIDGEVYLWSQAVRHRPATSVQEVLPHLCDGPAAIDTGGVQPVTGSASLLSPLPTPRRDLMCLGKNYVAHAEEFDRVTRGAGDLPDAPIVFTKATTAVCGNGAVVTVDPGISRSIDYEGELAVVIGREARKINQEDALEHVAGYTIVNDLTARDLQQKHEQWFVGKSLDGFAPMGPVIVSRDELSDPSVLELSTYVDGEVRQRASTGLMIFDVPFVVAFLSRILTLQVGDIIAMGTPKGVGMGFDPPRFLGDGSRVEVEISGIGRLTNTISFEDGSGR